ncbi:MAG TPA: choice-of-anchor tandem repeat GloVer-containing protein [Chthoniobacteraceae bacterium]|nr:choice-of-anchor tandem repeat GloVer-containing protein [Chthoniobacteraceae bacterium]
MLFCWSGLAPFVQAGYFADDFLPWTAAEGRDGNYYCGLLEGGLPGGELCRFTRGGTLRRLQRFAVVRYGPAHLERGTNPSGRLSVGQDGAIYGTTYDGGVFAAGVIFRVDPRGAYTTLHHFESGGGYPGATLAASNGDVYATTGYDRQKMVHLHRDGRSVYSATPGTAVLFSENANHEVILATFSYVAPPGAPAHFVGQLWRVTADDQFVAVADVDGIPKQLILLQDGSLLYVGSDKIQRVSTTGQVTTVHQFTVPGEGLDPLFVVEAKDGNYYGNTRIGGLENSGTVFRIASDTGDFTVLSQLRRAGPLGPGMVWLKSVLPLWTAASAGNIRPRALDDVVEAASLQPRAPGGLPMRVVSVLRNDADADHDPLSVVSVSTPSHGVAAFDFVAQKITYTANAAHVENDAFSYTIVDGSGGSANGQVIIRANAAGQYLGDVSSLPNATTGDPGTKVGTLSLSVNTARVCTARLDLLGRVYRFARPFNDWNGTGVVLANNPRLGTSVDLALWLRPNGAGWTVEATIRKDGQPYAASCVPGVQ